MFVRNKNVSNIINKKKKTKFATLDYSQTKLDNVKIKKNALESIADGRSDVKQTKKEKRRINFAFKLFMDLNFTRQNVFTKKSLRRTTH